MVPRKISILLSIIALCYGAVPLVSAQGPGAEEAREGTPQKDPGGSDTIFTDTSSGHASEVGDVKRRGSDRANDRGMLLNNRESISSPSNTDSTSMSPTRSREQKYGNSGVGSAGGSGGSTNRGAAGAGSMGGAH